MALDHVSPCMGNLTRWISKKQQSEETRRLDITCVGNQAIVREAEYSLGTLVLIKSVQSKVSTVLAYNAVRRLVGC